MKIDNVSFNVNAIKEMDEQQFVDSHTALRHDLTDELRIKWLKMCYARIVGKKKLKTKNDE